MSTKHPLAVWRENQEPPITQEAFGKASGLSRWSVAMIERGKRAPGRDAIARMIRATGNELSFEDFLPDEPSSNGVAA